MAGNLTTREELTKVLVEQLGQSAWTEKEANKRWWVNLRKNGGYRLTDTGYIVLKDVLEIETYSCNISFKLPWANWLALLLSLERKLKSPYYIKSENGSFNSIELFGSKEAMMLTLYGDLIKYLNSIK